MKDYIRRSVKFIIYIILIFVLVLGIFPLISHGKPLIQSMHELLQNSRFTLMFGLLIAYGMAYPMISFVKLKRHLNGSFAENRDKFEKAFAALNYIKTDETPDKVIYRKEKQFSRLLQWYEDEITVYTTENPVIISGFRKWVIRLDRMIDQSLIRENE
jgi:hypothetical protein